MKKIIFVVIFFLHSLYAEYSIVFVHIGNRIPAYAETAIAQAVLFNPKAAIYLIANQAALLQFQKKNRIPSAHFVSCESLTKSSLHLTFNKISRVDRTFKEGFWSYAVERFFYLHDFMLQYGITNLFHLENDNMLYADLETLLPLFQDYYPGIGATFHNDQWCIPGFVYIANSPALERLCACMLIYAPQGYFDMQMLAFFKNQNGKECIDYLPIVPDRYIELKEMRSKEDHTTTDPSRFHNHFDRFNSIFDGATLGQYLSGIDPFHGHPSPGYVNPSSIFDPTLFTFEWLEDEAGRKVPYATIADKKCRINSLHIHSKKLENFYSK